MNVLYLVFEALLGGHVISASTVAKEMKNYGVNPVFAGAEGKMADDIRKWMLFESVEIPVFHGTRQTYFTWSSFPAVQKIREIIRSRKIHIIHAFDARSYFHAYLAGILEDIPVVCTLCGGTDPYYNLPIAPTIIVFSEEQKQKMLKEFGWSSKNVDVVRTRLDVKQITCNDNHLSDDDANLFDLDFTIPKVMMISSFDGTKIGSINKVFDAAEILFDKGLKFQLIMIGGKGHLHEAAKARSEEINKRLGAKLIVMTGPVMKAFRLLQRADIVLGVGRSAFEGMAYARPTLVVGENGFAGVVCPEEVDEIAWYNFSGRNQKKIRPPELLVGELVRLLEDPQRRAVLGAFGRNYVNREIDVVLGAQRIFNIYERMLRSDNRIKPLRRFFSIAKCLVPVALDNGLHSLKERVKKILQLRSC
jgi:UDP-N-acetylglucosamine:LPS N-acetylglucosamine transferase